MAHIIQLKYRATIGFFLITLFGGAVFTAILGGMMSDMITDRIYVMLTAATGIEEVAILDRLDHYRHELKSFSAASPIIGEFLERQNDPALRDAVVQQLKDVRSTGTFAELLVLAPDGSILAHTYDGRPMHNMFMGLGLEQEKRDTVRVHGVRYCSIDRKHFLDLTTPVFNDSGTRLIGTVVARVEWKDMQDLLMNDLRGFGAHSQIYLVGRDGFLMTPSKFLTGENKGVFVQRVDSRNAINCFKDSGGQTRSERIAFLDFRGEWVVGVNQKIDPLDACLLIEVDKSESTDVVRRVFMQRIATLVLFVVLFCTLVGFGVDRYQIRKKRDV